jgi:copper(I)-binding protein
MKTTLLASLTVLFALSATVANAGGMGGSMGAHPQGITGIRVEVSNAWVEAPAAGQDAANLYMDLVTGVDAHLVSAFSPAAKRVLLRGARAANGQPQGGPSARIATRADQLLRLMPGGQHLQLVGLTKPLTVGSTVSATISFEGVDGQRQQTEVSAEVRGARRPEGA